MTHKIGLHEGRGALAAVGRTRRLYRATFDHVNVFGAHDAERALLKNVRLVDSERIHHSETRNGRVWIQHVWLTISDDTTRSFFRNTKKGTRVQFIGTPVEYVGGVVASEKVTLSVSPKSLILARKNKPLKIIVGGGEMRIYRQHESLYREIIEGIKEGIAKCF